MFTVNANKYHVNTILIIFQAYLFTVSLIIHSEILRKIQFWKLKTNGRHSVRENVINSQLISIITRLFLGIF